MRSIARRVAAVVAVVMLSMIMLPTRAFALIDINEATHNPVKPQYLVGSPSAAKPKPYLEYNGRTLEEGVDYTLHWEDNTAPGTGSIWVHGEGPFTASMQIEFEILSGSPVPIYRMYNTKTSEHLYTTNVKEYNSCGTGAYKDWNAESTAWFAPEPTYPGAKPVYRLYNTKSGDHHYTTAVGEKDKLLASGDWNDEGIAFYSGGDVWIHRLYNGKLKRGQHHYTTSYVEVDSLTQNSGWNYEGIGLYAAVK